MSFSSEQKENIITQVYKPCCRKSLLTGVVFSKAVISEGIVRINIEKKSTADFVLKLIREFYSTEAKIYRESTGGRYYVLSFASKSCERYIDSIEMGAEMCPFKCPGCLSSFLRGVFLASGKISDPKKQYSMEFSLGDRALIFADFLSEYGSVPLVSYKKSGAVAYFKSSSSIEEFCALSSMNKVMFDLFNARAEGEMRRNVSRRINCETNNIAKAVNAAAKQIEVISKLEEQNLLSSLPEELEITARLRLQNKDLSLSQLAAVAVPPISKPGLSHRLKKIMELGSQLLEEK